MKDKTLKFPHAFCFELDKMMTPKDVMDFRKKFPHKKTTFKCPSCFEDILFVEKSKGKGSTVYKPIFKGRMNETHLYCNRFNICAPFYKEEDNKLFNPFRWTINKFKESIFIYAAFISLNSYASFIDNNENIIGYTTSFSYECNEKDEADNPRWNKYVTDFQLKDVIYDYEKYKLNWMLSSEKQDSSFTCLELKENPLLWCFFRYFLESSDTYFHYDETSPKISFFLNNEFRFSLRSKIKISNLNSEFNMEIIRP